MSMWNGYQDGKILYTKMRSKREVSVISVLWSCFSFTFLRYTLYKLISDILTFVSPQILR
jgi:hypothetical protein